MKISRYNAYWTTEPSERARRKTAITIKQKIYYSLQKETRYPNIQDIIVTALNNGFEFNIGAIYCPSRHSIKTTQYAGLLNRLGSRFVIRETSTSNTLGTKTYVLAHRQFHSLYSLAILYF